MSKRYIQNCTGEGCSGSNKKETNHLVRRTIFYVLAISFVVVAIYLFLFSLQLQISKITVTGTQELDSSEITDKIEQSLQGNYFGIIPKNNFLFISRSSIEGMIKENYKKVRSANVTKKFPDKIDVVIDERKGLLVWCRSAEECFLLDENGIAYNRADFSSPDLVQNHLLQINDFSGAAVTIGDKVIGDNYEKYLLSIDQSLKNLGIEIVGQYETPSRMAEEIKVNTVHGFYLIFSTQFELDNALKTLEIVLKKEIPSDKQNNLAYIDLRSENKVFYKFNSAPENTEVKNITEEKKDDSDKEKK